MKISLIIPCYNEEQALYPLYEALQAAMQQLQEYSFELLFIDDGSSDGTLDVLKLLAQKDERITYLSFSRNFGKEAAMYAGFCNSTGDYAAIMDADMQDPPDLLPRFFRYLLTNALWHQSNIVKWHIFQAFFQDARQLLLSPMLSYTQPGQPIGWKAWVYLWMLRRNLSLLCYVMFYIKKLRRKRRLQNGGEQ